MTKVSAGILLFRHSAQGIEVLLVHMGGPYWARRERGAWSIPKGEPLSNEELLDAAKREFREETGFLPRGPFLPLDAVRQTGGKIVHAWAAEGAWDPARLRSDTFALEWPPHSGKHQEFPEVDRAAWFGLAEARAKLVTGQVPLLDRILRITGEHAG